LKEKHIDILAELYNNVLLFATFLLSHHFNKKPADFHNEIFKHLRKGYKQTAIVAPRGHAKSTVVTLAYVLYCILFKRANFILIISDTYTQAKYFLDAIKKEFETNDLIKFLFGSLQGGVWGESEIETANGVRIVCRGAEQKIRGLKWKQHRPDLIIVDDLENDELVASKDRREKLERWFFGSVIPSLSDKGRLIIIGTILHYDSLLNKLAKNEDFNPLFYRAIQDNKPLWGARFTLEDLNAIKENYKKQGLLDVFYCEYMNEPISDENAIFKKAYFKYYEDDESITKSLTKVMTVDLAISEKESADYTVIMVTGIDALNQIYVLEYIRARINPIETIENIFKLASKWKVSKIGIEGVAYQRSLQWFLAEEMRRRNEFYLIEELKADTDKERRIRGIQPRYAVGAVFHKPFMTDLEEELLLFPKSPHDDLADALAYVPQIAFRGVGAVEIKKPETQREEAYRLAIEGQENDWSSY